MDGDAAIADNGIEEIPFTTSPAQSLTRMAIVSTHPIQYYAPWFRHIQAHSGLQLRVFYLLQPPDSGLYDRGFARDVRWDMPLLDGYPFEFVPNVSARPGTGHFMGLRNPSLAKRVRAFAPDAVLLNGYNFWSLVRFALTWPRTRAPLIFRGDSHRIAVRQTVNRRVKDVLISFLFSRFSAFLYVGQANFRYFRSHGVSEERLFHAPHAVDSGRFSVTLPEIGAAALEWRRALGIPDEHLVVLFAGKFEEKKRPLDLLKAFRFLNAQGATLLFVGSGPLDAQLRGEAAQVPNVRFAPFQNQSQMPRTYAACDLLVLPSYGQFETWGLAVNEAMCMGKPSIVSSHVGCAEDLVLPHRTGLIFEAGEIDSLVDALRIALADRLRLAEWGLAAAARVRQFSYAEATRGLLEAVEFAIKAK